MKNMIGLMVIIVMITRLNEASSKSCKLNEIEVHNQLRPGTKLKVHCRRNYLPTKDFLVQEVNHTVPYKITFSEPAIPPFKRTVYSCNVWYREKSKGYHCAIDRAYRSAFISRCGKFRIYFARPNGIYFTRNHPTPPELKFHWTPTKPDPTLKP